MLLVCPSCASEYAVAPERIGPSGRNVRCAACRTAWFVPASAGEAAQGDTRGAAALPARQTAAKVIDGVAGHPSRTRPSRRAAGRPGAAAAGAHRAERLAIAATIFATLLLPAAILMREPVVRAVPASGALFGALGLPVNLVGLDLADLSSATTVEQDGGRVLLVEGAIRHAADARRTVPRLEYRVESADGSELYRWSTKPPVEAIAPGESVRFTARLASPPPAGKRVVVSFASERGQDAVALR